MKLKTKRNDYKRHLGLQRKQKRERTIHIIVNVKSYSKFRKFMTSVNKQTKEDIKRKTKLWRESNRKELLLKKKIHYEKNKDHYSKMGRMNYLKNRDKKIKYQKEWQKNNPDKRLIHQKTYLSKQGESLNRNSWEYLWALHCWAKKIQDDYNNRCQLCFQEAEQTHHILYKSNYPELALNENNGIPLCLKCHKETHGWKLGIKRKSSKGIDLF